MSSDLQNAPGWSFLRSPRWLGYWAMLAVFSIVCVFLGNWQFARRAEAQAEIARIDANYGAEAIPLAEALPTLDSYDPDRNKWQPVTVVGEYLQDDALLVRNRPNASKVGFEILAPLQLANGDVFVVNRGWIPAGDDPNDTTPTIPELPTGEVTVTARLMAGEPTIPGRTPVENTVGTLNLPEIESMLGLPVYTAAYGQLMSERPASEHGILPSKPERDEGPHLSYALQWYVFIVIALLGTLYGARQEYRALNPDSARTRAQDARAQARKRSRGLSDAEDEDAYLDAQETLRNR